MKEADVLDAINNPRFAQHCFDLLDQPEYARQRRVETVTLTNALGQQELLLIVFDRLLPSAFPKPRKENP